MEREKCANMCNNNESNLECEYDISCFQKIAGILTGEEIIHHKLIIPEDNTPKDSLKPTTFDLTLGEGHYVYSGETVDTEERWKLVFIGKNERLKALNEDSEEIEKYNWPGGNRRMTLTIPAYGSALIQLNETVDTYTVAEEKKILVVGRFDLKLGNVHKGLISQQATQVEPYYKGKLFCFIHNLSNKGIELKYGDKIATIEFSYVSCFCNKHKREEILKDLKEINREKYKGQPYCNDNGITEVRYFRAKERLPDDCGLLGLRDRILEDIKKDGLVEHLAKSELFMESLVKKIGKMLQR